MPTSRRTRCSNTWRPALGGPSPPPPQAHGQRGIVDAHRCGNDTLTIVTWRPCWALSPAELADGSDGPVGCGLLAHLDALACGDSQQVCRAPDDVGLEAVQASLEVGRVPHHLHHAAPALFVEGILDLPRELIEVDGFPFRRMAILDEPRCGRVVEPES